MEVSRPKSNRRAGASASRKGADQMWDSSQVRLFPSVSLPRLDPSPPRSETWLSADANDTIWPPSSKISMPFRPTRSLSPQFDWTTTSSTLPWGSTGIPRSSCTAVPSFSALGPWST